MTNNNELRKRLEDIRNEYVSALCGIEDKPEGWLPHIVYVEEEGNDYPVYTRYTLMDIKCGGTTIMADTNGDVTDLIHLSEVCVDWLETLLTRYDELCSEQGIK